MATARLTEGERGDQSLRVDDLLERQLLEPPERLERSTTTTRAIVMTRVTSALAPDANALVAGTAHCSTPR
jgi:hypothetical protein